MPTIKQTYTGSLVLNGSDVSTAWTPYIPNWTSDSAIQPVLADGNITGAYKQIGKTVFVRVELNWGPSTQGGNGTWYFSLPVTASNPGGIQFPCSMLDNGNAWYQATVNGQYGGFTDKTALIGQSAGGANSAQSITAIFPFTWGVADSLHFNGTYQSI